jgi:hypothetical protein
MSTEWKTAFQSGVKAFRENMYEDALEHFTKVCHSSNNRVKATEVLITTLIN